MTAPQQPMTISCREYAGCRKPEGWLFVLRRRLAAPKAAAASSALAPGRLGWLLLFSAPLAYFFVISFWSVRAGSCAPISDRELCRDNRRLWRRLLDDAHGRLRWRLRRPLSLCLRLCHPFPGSGDGEMRFLLVTLITLFGGYLVRSMPGRAFWPRRHHQRRAARTRLHPGTALRASSTAPKGW